MTNKLKDLIYIGTSGIAVPGNKNSFPPQFISHSRLHYYATHFNSVELNSSFYKIPMYSTFVKWAMDVPENFKFTIKLFRDITHIKNLDYDIKNIDAFCTAAAGLDSKTGCLLIQFPGKISLDHFTQVENILKRLAEQNIKNKWRTAIEFRNQDWYVGETFEMLQQYKASMVLHDFSKAKNLHLPINNKFIYLRFHGPEGDYKGSYSNQFLEEYAQTIKTWLNDNKQVYVYFNNTMGAAWQNAATLKTHLIKII